MQDRKPSPLQRGGTLQGAAAAGKDASDKFKAAAEGASSTSGPVLQVRAQRRRQPSPSCQCSSAGSPSQQEPLVGQQGSAAARPPRPHRRPRRPAPAVCLLLQMVEGRFSDFRWKGGRWDLSMFK